VLLLGTCAFPRKRLVKFCTKRFRGNVTDIVVGAVTTRVDARLAACEYATESVMARIPRPEHGTTDRFVPAERRRHQCAGRTRGWPTVRS
jgi:hypothetical protein